MLYPIKIIDIELSRPLVTLDGLDGYIAIQGLVRLHGVPLGYIKAPITTGRCMAETLSKLILEKHSWTIINHLLQNGLAAPPQPEGLNLEDLFDVRPLEYDGDWPLVTVAVCSRDRVSDLSLCLNALSCLDYPNLEILVVDNAPTSNATQELVEKKYPQVRYVCEPRPGLDWARNRAIIEARGEIIAYTDDDVIVDALWVKALAKVFVENPQVMALTGLVVPYELETEAQVLFEMYGGFGRGFERKWSQVAPNRKIPWRQLGTGQFGTGANMAYRRCVFEAIGYFDPALDVGTLTNGAGDLEMFFRVLKAGYTLVYEPEAIVRHRHRREYAKLKTQITNNGSLYTYFLCSALSYPDQRLSFLWLGIWWFFYWNIRRLVISFIHPLRFPQELILAELWGDFVGLTTYQKAQRKAAEIAESFGPISEVPLPGKYISQSKKASQSNQTIQEAVKVNLVELSQPLKCLTNLSSYDTVKIFVTWRGQLLGNFDLNNYQQDVGISRLRTAIVDCLGFKLLDLNSKLSKDACWAKALATVNRRYSVSDPTTLECLPEHVPVSLIIGTCDRPDDLRKCLFCLVQQDSRRPIDIVVVDNRPASGLTPPVVAEFPNVLLINEPRQGVAYARNAGITASKGEIIVTTDDDTTMPPDWLEKLIAPLTRPDVMAVSGNVLPLELETSSQQLFEKYGGLGRGFDSFEVGGDWFEQFRLRPVPTWNLGGTANAAFRASIFNHPQIGLFDEALGPGMPSGVGEDSYLFYKILKVGYTIFYEPTAYIWHKHRSSLSSLRRQIYNYSKGHVSHHLTTLLQDKDWRGMIQLLVGLPLAHASRTYWRLRGYGDYPISLILLEMAGNFAGYWSLWQSHRRVNQEGRSLPYIPVAEREALAPEVLTTSLGQLSLKGLQNLQQE